MNAGSSKWLLGIGALVVVLVVASVLIAVLGGDSVEDHPADTPEGVVQRYLQAMSDGDASLALSYMEQEARDGCTVQEVTQQARWFTEDSGRRSIELVETTELSGGGMQVEVRVTEVRVEPPFGIDEWSYTEWLRLIPEDGDWVIEYPAWPVNWCQALQDSRAQQ